VINEAQFFRAQKKPFELRKRGTAQWTSLPESGRKKEKRERWVYCEIGKKRVYSYSAQQRINPQMSEEGNPQAKTGEERTKKFDLGGARIVALRRPRRGTKRDTERGKVRGFSLFSRQRIKRGKSKSAGARKKRASGEKNLGLGKGKVMTTIISEGKGKGGGEVTHLRQQGPASVTFKKKEGKG